MKHDENIAKAMASINTATEHGYSQYYRPKFHFSPPTGWLNDPNGLVFFRGKYHIFYQHNPYAPFWNTMHWGHATSTDLISWEHLPIALAPSEPYDTAPRGGCFSGSAIVKDGKLYLFYTGTTEIAGVPKQTQCLAVSTDGIIFEKDKHNPIIPYFPSKDSSLDFRDPKVFFHENIYYMIVGTSLGGAEQSGTGRVIMYKSGDLHHWNYCGVICQTDGKLGTMWECPDLFFLQGKWVLLFSPMGIAPTKTYYMVGNMDFVNYKFTPQMEGELDYGSDFYAPQTFTDDKNRRLMIGWHDTWDLNEKIHPTIKENWRGFLSVARELSLSDDLHLLAYPVKELQEYYSAGQKLEKASITSIELPLDTPTDNCYNLDFTIDVDRSSSEKFELIIDDKDSDPSVIFFDLANNLVGYRSSNIAEKGVVQREIPFKFSSKLKVRILSDRCSTDVFLDNGLVNFTLNIFFNIENIALTMRSTTGITETINLKISPIQ